MDVYCLCIYSDDMPLSVTTLSAYKNDSYLLLSITYYWNSPRVSSFIEKYVHYNVIAYSYASTHKAIAALNVLSYVNNLASRFLKADLHVLENILRRKSCNKASVYMCVCVFLSYKL